MAIATPKAPKTDAYAGQSSATCLTALNNDKIQIKINSRLMSYFLKRYSEAGMI